MIRLEYIITDFKIALEKSEMAEKLDDFCMSYAILRSVIIAKIRDLETLQQENTYE